jgi:uncharacterized protein YfaP (DUF2135 family)
MPRRFHVDFNSRSYYEDGTAYSDSGKLAVDLDYDSMTPWGTEIITVRKLTPGDYCFYIHDFTNAGSDSPTALARTRATVKVYRGTSATPLATFVADEASGGTLWKVFKLTIGSSGNTTITPVGDYSYSGVYDLE